MSLLQIILTVFAAAGGTAAAQNNLPPDVQAMAKKVMMPLVLKVPGMDKVKVIQNLKYTKSDDPNVLMDIYISPDLAESAKRPVVIFLHGGAKTDYTPKRLGPLHNVGPFDRSIRICWSNFHSSTRVSESIFGKGCRGRS